jgi:hypothetical protein
MRMMVSFSTAYNVFLALLTSRNETLALSPQRCATCFTTAGLLCRQEPTALLSADAQLRPDIIAARTAMHPYAQDFDFAISL